MIKLIQYGFRRTHIREFSDYARQFLRDILQQEEFNQTVADSQAKINKYQADIKDKQQIKKQHTEQVKSRLKQQIDSISECYKLAIETHDRDTISLVLKEYTQRIPQLDPDDLVKILSIVPSYNPKMLIYLDQQKKDDNPMYYEKSINSKHTQLLARNNDSENLDGTISRAKGAVNLFKGILGMKVEVEPAEKVKTPDELLHDFINFYENSERRLRVDWLNGRKYTTLQSSKIIESFSKSGEGSNGLYEILIKWFISSEANKDCLEKFIRYFPHEIWTKQAWSLMRKELDSLYSICTKLVLKDEVRDCNNFLHFMNDHTEK